MGHPHNNSNDGKRIKSKWLDFASMGLSGLCVVHCLALPFVVALLPVAGVFAGNSWVHPILVMLAAPLSLWAIIASNAWRKWRVSALIVVGLAMLGLAAFVEALEPIEVAMSVIGASCIAAAHLLNYLTNRPLHIHTHTADCGHTSGD